MAKFIKTNPSGKIEISIKKNFDKSYDHNRKNIQNRVYKEYGTNSWVKVVFSDGAGFDQEWVRQELQKAATGPNSQRECVLQLFNYRVNEESATLFIKLTTISFSSFKNNCNKIPHPHSGQPCDVIVMSIDNPETMSTLPDTWINVLKDALSLRYNNDKKSLNLSNFTEDSHLKSQGLWMSLTKPAVVRAISNLLKSIGDLSLSILNLRDNGLTFSTHLIPLLEAVPVQSIDLSGNCLIWRSLLQTLQSAAYLTTLTINNDSGMVGQKMRYRGDYLTELVENCPTLEIFNDTSVASDIGGVIGTIRLPPSKKSTNDQLLTEFFMEYGRNLEANRDALLDYYSSDSVLTISACYHDMSMNNRRLGEVYLRNSRNLERLKDESKRRQLVKRGSAQILGLLAELPRLKHIWDSLIVDSIVNDDTSKVFVVNGLFVECIRIANRTKLDNRDEGSTGSHHNIFNVRMFSRALVVVRPGKIVQENWTITNPTDFLFRKYRDKFDTIKATFDTESTAPLIKSIDTKPNGDAIIEQLCQFSSMNKIYSQQCLQESNWNLDKAKEMFQLAFNSGKIPQEAFLH